MFGAAVAGIEYHVYAGNVGACGDEAFFPTGSRDLIAVVLYLPYGKHDSGGGDDHAVAGRVRGDVLSRGGGRGCQHS